MKLLFITPGSGDNFYCENCMRDRALVDALAHAGADVTFMPLYLPVDLSANSSSVGRGPLFFGGINVWLEQKIPFYNHLPACITKLFNSRWMLAQAAKRAGMTDPSTLGDMTLSMLQGLHGKQKRDLDQLIDWLKLPEHRPDIVCISNALLSGIAPAISQQLNIPVVSFLQDEDGFLDSLGKYAEPSWRQLRDNCSSIAGFIAVSQFYADFMTDRLALAPGRITACYSGVNFDDYTSITPKTKPPLTIGYLSRICPAKGFDRLVQSYLRLRKLPDFADLRLIVSGGSIGDDKFIAKQKQILANAGTLSSVTFTDDFVELADRLQFFASIDLLCVPERDLVAHGRYFIEACAANVPVLVPDLGVFPELTARVCPDFTFQANSDQDLDNKLTYLLTKYPKNSNLATKARPHFDITTNAQQIHSHLKTLIS